MKTSILVLRWPELEITFLPLSGYNNDNRSHISSAYCVPKTKLPSYINSFNPHPHRTHSSEYFQFMISFFRWEHCITEFSNLNNVAGFMSSGFGFKPRWTDFPAYLLNLITLPKVLFKVEDVSGHKETKVTKRALPYSLS